MPPRVAAELICYANLLSEYAQAMVEFCDDPQGDRLLARIARPETECFRLPVSLIDYARQLARLHAADAVQSEKELMGGNHGQA